MEDFDLGGGRYYQFIKGDGVELTEDEQNALHVFKEINKTVFVAFVDNFDIYPLAIQKYIASELAKELPIMDRDEEDHGGRQSRSQQRKVSLVQYILEQGSRVLSHNQTAKVADEGDMLGNYETSFNSIQQSYIVKLLKIAAKAQSAEVLKELIKFDLKDSSAPR